MTERVPNVRKLAAEIMMLAYDIPTEDGFPNAALMKAGEVMIEQSVNIEILKLRVENLKRQLKE